MNAVDAWLYAARVAIARKGGLDPAQLDLDAASTATILDVARVAAHESGARTNAPLVCYLLGLARSGDATLEDLADAVRRSSS
jgi:Domain of unknown function (DUF6457)